MNFPSREQVTLALVLSLSLFSFGCGRTSDDGKQTIQDDVLLLEGTMRLERSENQVTIRSALPVLTEQRVTIELRDFNLGNASNIKISARDKSWNVRLSGKKSVTSKPFSVSTISDKQEIQIKGMRVENVLGEKQATEAKTCQRTVEMNYQCRPPQPCGPQPRPVYGMQSVKTSFQEVQVKYEFVLSDKTGAIATIFADPKVINRILKVDSGTCR